MNKIKIKGPTIDDIVREEIKRFLNEELSISDKVVDITNDLYHHIIDGNYNFVYPFDDVGDITVKVKIEKGEGNNGSSTGNVDFDKNALTIVVKKGLKGINKEALLGTIQHEVEHIFQYCKRTNKEQPYRDLYKMAINRMNAEGLTQADKNLATLIYCCDLYEQDAFVNELFRSLEPLSVLENKERVERLRKSKAYYALYIIRNMINDMEDIYNAYDFMEASSYYGKRTSWFLSLARQREQRLRTKIMKVYQRALDSVSGQERTMPFIDYTKF